MRKLFLLITVLFFFACENQVFDPSTSDVLVVEAYLYEGQPIDSVKISQLIPLISEADIDYTISDADVFITWNEVDFLLSASEDEPGNYFYDGDEIQIIPGQTYNFKVNYFGKEVTSATTVPLKPSAVSISTREIEIEPIRSFEDIGDREDFDNIEIYWNNTAGEYFFVTVENIENNPEEINQLDFEGMERPNFNLIIPPTNLDVYNIPPPSLSQYGTYRVVVFHVNQEYVDLYETTEQDSRNLTEPLSNINNGVGIFTSFSSDTIYFEVVKP